MGSPSNLPCNIVDVVDLIGIQVVRNTGTQLHCRCPFCDDRKAHMNVKIDKNVFRCNRCGKGGGVLHLYADVHEISLSAAYDELCRIYSSDEGRLRRENLLVMQKAMVVKPEMPIATSGVRDNTYSNLLSLLTLGQNHRESLRQRGLSEEEIDRLGYRTTPAFRSSRIVTELLERGCELQGVPGFYCDSETSKWKLDIRGSGIMIPDRNSEGLIEAIQVRLDRPGRSKFYNLTSVDQYYGTAAACCPHFAGLTDEAEEVYLTEGVMKADIAHYFSREIGQPFAFVGLTGVGSTNQYLRALSELKKLRVRTIKVAFDMDAASNENVRNARERVLELGSEQGFQMIPKCWNTDFKGIDDFLKSMIDKRNGQK